MSSQLLFVDIQTSSLRAPTLLRSSHVKETKLINNNDDHNETQRQHLEENDILFFHLDNKTY